MGAHRPDQGPDGEKENAGFPELAATGQKRLRKREIGLLDKTRQRLGDVALARAGQFKIAIAGLGARRVDAEGDDLTRACGRNLTQDSGPKIRRTGHQMVGGGDQNQRLGVCVGQVQRRSQHGRAGVARRRLDHDGAGIDPGRRQLFGHDEAEIGAGYNHWWRELGARQAPHPLLEERGLTHQRREQEQSSAASAIPAQHLRSFWRDRQSNAIRCNAG